MSNTIIANLETNCGDSPVSYGYRFSGERIMKYLRSQLGFNFDHKFITSMSMGVENKYLLGFIIIPANEIIEDSTSTSSSFMGKILQSSVESKNFDKEKYDKLKKFMFDENIKQLLANKEFVENLIAHGFNARTIDLLMKFYEKPEIAEEHNAVVCLINLEKVVIDMLTNPITGVPDGVVKQNVECVKNGDDVTPFINAYVITSKSTTNASADVIINSLMGH